MEPDVALSKLFGTDGIRGVANIEPMTVETALKVGQGTAALFRGRKGRRARIVIGKDTRLSGYMLENAIASGICSMGVDVLLVGPLPTPGIAFLTRSMRADAGVVISASHNPYQDNGIKIFSADGFKLPDDLEARIEGYVRYGQAQGARPTASHVGKAYRVDDARGRYIVFLKNSFPQELDLEGFRIVVDCAHGAAYKVAPLVLEELGAEVVPIGVEPNGQNINHGCGSTLPELMCRTVVSERATLGIALDGDGDRVILSDEKGKVVDGDQIMAMAALDMDSRGKLARKSLVATVMSNMGMEVALRRRGIQVVRTAVGDRYVVEEMRKGGYNLGGEQSGHVVFLEQTTTGDGMITALQILSLLVRSGRSLSELASSFEPYPQVLKNIPVSVRLPLEEVEPLKRAVEAAQDRLDGKGRVLVRYSGTELLLRVMVEGEDNSLIQSIARELEETVRRELCREG